jgi:hypothetical protein
LKSSKYWLPLLKKHQQVKGGDFNKQLPQFMEEIKARGKTIDQGFEEDVKERFKGFVKGRKKAEDYFK